MRQFDERDNGPDRFDSGMIATVTPPNPTSRWGRYTLRTTTTDQTTCLRQFSYREVQSFVVNPLLSLFIEAIKKYRSNVAVGDRLENLTRGLSCGHQNPLFTINEISFASPLISPWEENNRVYLYLYRRTDTEARGPGIMMPGFVEGSPMTRAAALLLVEEGWTVLEVAMPFYGNRTVFQTQPQALLSERYAALKLTPTDFCGYIQQAVDDIRRSALWFSTLPFIDSGRVAIWGFSFAASAALTAYATSEVLTHAVGICPPVDWAHAIWTAPDQRAYLAFLQSIQVTRKQFRRIVSPFQLDYLPPLENRTHQSKIFYVKGDPYAVPSAMKSLTKQFAMAPSFVADGSKHNKPHLTGLHPYFATIVESTAKLVTRK